MKSTLLKLTVGLLTVSVLFTGLMGFAHTKSGRPILIAIGKMMGKKEFCPLGYDRTASSDERKLLREKRRSIHAHEVAALSRPTLNFELGKTTRSEIRQWMKENNGTCKELASGFDSECSGPFFGSLSSTVWLEFDEQAKLVTLRGIEKFKERDKAWSFFKEYQQDLKTKLRHSIVASGVQSAEDLSPLLSQSLLVANFNNYALKTRIGNVGDGYVVTQDDQSF